MLRWCLTEKQAAVVDECDDVIKINNPPSIGGWRHASVFDDHVVKIGNVENPMDIFFQADTQAFVYAASKNSPGAPRVPEVYDCFRWNNNLTYLVMERVDHPSVESWVGDTTISPTEADSRFEIACQAVADALRWLFSLTPPAGADIGLIKGSYAQTHVWPEGFRENSGTTRNVMFGEDGAPYRYPDGVSLERHITMAISRRPPCASPCEVNFSDEPLKIVQCEVKPSHFLIDPKTRQVTLIDFGCVCVLPSSFIGYTMHRRKRRFIADVNKYLKWEWSDNITGLRGAWMMALVSGNDFGLDKYGFPKHSSKKRKYPSGRTRDPRAAQKPKND